MITANTMAHASCCCSNGQPGDAVDCPQPMLVLQLSSPLVQHHVVLLARCCVQEANVQQHTTHLPKKQTHNSTSPSQHNLPQPSACWHTPNSAQSCTCACKIVLLNKQPTACSSLLCVLVQTPCVSTLDGTPIHSHAAHVAKPHKSTSNTSHEHLATHCPHYDRSLRCVTLAHNCPDITAARHPQYDYTKGTPSRVCSAAQLNH